MISRKMTYEDYNGQERTEEFFFNLTQAELMEFETSVDGGVSAMLGRIVETTNVKAIISVFKDLILKAYGEKSLDGRKFIKSKELSEAFAQTQAYSDLFMELATDADAASAFVNSLIPPPKK